MSAPLLASKFRVPPIGARAVRRPRLARLLDVSLERSAALVLVCGPAGYGKTTMVSEWLQTSPKVSPAAFSWLTLERGDDDLTRFLTYFITALQHIRPGFGEGVLRMLQTHKPAPVADLATLLVNEINEIAGQFILVLDDYHLLAAQTIQNFIAFLVEHQPPQMCLVLVTRTDPPLPLARLRARGQLVELRQHELCFQPGEMAEFANQSMGLDLPVEQLAILAKQTEGWISGLQLAAISMRAMADRAAFLSAFSGEHEFIADYLTEEVLSRLPETLRSFLLRSSILERLSAPLCEAVTGQPEAQALLDQLVAANLFILPLDDRHDWYRYHTLFSDLLRKRLQATPGEEVAELHERASRWFEVNGYPDLAIEQAIAAKSFERACRLIEQTAESLVMRGQVVTVLRWLEALPQAEVACRPLLGSVYGFALILCGRPALSVTTLLDQMRASCQPGDPQGEVITLQGLLAVLQGDAPLAIRLSEQALTQLPAERAFFRSLAADTLGMGSTLAGDIPAATRAFQQVAEISQQSGNLMMTITALNNLAGLQYFHGFFRTAYSTCQQALELARATIGSRAPMIGRTLLNLGEITREQGDLETAYRYLREAADLMETFSGIGPSIAYLSIARLEMNRADWLAAQSSIDRALSLARASQSTKIDEALVETVQALLWIRHGELIQAAGWARDCGLLDRSASELLGKPGEQPGLNELLLSKILVLVRLYLAQGKPAQAGELIDRLIDANRTLGYHRREVQYLVLKAISLQQLNQSERALETLKGALQTGEAQGYFLTFVEEGEPLARLLYAAIQRKLFPAYASRLLDAITTQLPSAEAKAEKANGLVEPLSARELDVLRAIAQGYANAEIARRLYISLSTVKGHTTSIFGKLSVKNRTQAVARARSLGLLPPDDDHHRSPLE